MTAPALPTVDVVVALSRHTRVRDGGTTLVGGSPTRVLHLTGSAARLLDGGTLRATTPVARALAERLVETGLANPVLASLPEVAAVAVTVVGPVRAKRGAACGTAVRRPSRAGWAEMHAKAATLLPPEV